MRSTTAGSRSFSGCSTTRPFASASSLTAEDRETCPRPAGRSGCVNTAATACPRSRRAHRDAAAKDGVPMKTSFTVAVTAGRSDVQRGALRRFFLEPSLADHFLDLPLVEVTLQAADAIDEELAIEVVYLVL